MFTITLIVVGLSIALIVNSSTYEINQVAKKSSLKTVVSLIADSKKALGRLVVDYTWWDEAVENVRLTPNRDWMMSNYGQYFYEVEGITHVALLSEQDQIIYMSVDGENRNPADFETLASQLSKIADQARSLGEPQPKAAHDIVAAFDRYFMFQHRWLLPSKEVFQVLKTFCHRLWYSCIV